MAATDTIGRRVVVISPHSDDAVLSLGAWIANATARGTDVAVLTVFAGDPESTAAASDWDVRTGFASAGGSARGRRLEDARAFARLGVTDAHWLPYPYGGYERSLGDDAIRDAVRPFLEGAETALVPGFPLVHPDHALLTRALLRDGMGPRVALYVEQPYAFNRRHSVPRPVVVDELRDLVPADLEWTPLPASPRDRLRKRRAIREYASQLEGIGLGRWRGRLERLLAHEQLVARGERIAWLS